MTALEWCPVCQKNVVAVKVEFQRCIVTHCTKCNNMLFVDWKDDKISKKKIKDALDFDNSVGMDICSLCKENDSSIEHIGFCEKPCKKYKQIEKAIVKFAGEVSTWKK